MNRARIAAALLVWLATSTVTACSSASKDGTRERAEAVPAKATSGDERPRPKHVEVGLGEVLIPGGSVPEHGWPLVVLLHRDGGSRQEMRTFLDAIVNANVAAAAISAPLQAARGRVWPGRAGADMMGAYINEVLAPFRELPELDFGKIFIGGTEEGAWYAILLQGVFADVFAGVLAIEPRPVGREIIDAQAPDNRPLFIVHGATNEKSAYAAKHFQFIWRRDGVIERVVIVPAAEQDPGIWLDHVQAGAAWLDANASRTVKPSAAPQNRAYADPSP